MTNPERGRHTGQHEQPEQQAVMFRGCEEAMEEMEREKPVASIHISESTGILIRDAEFMMRCIAAMFQHPERIEVTRFRNLTMRQDAAGEALGREEEQHA